MYLIYALLAVGAGALLTIQPLMNGVVTRAVSNPIAATTVSGLVTFLSAFLMLSVTGRPGDFFRALGAFGSQVSWWIYLAGAIGTVFVLSGILATPVIGSAAFFVCVVAGQLIGATIADHFGLLGLTQHSVTLPRLLGLALVIAGCVIVQRS